MSTKKWKLIGYLLLVCVASCKEAFEPDIPALKQNFLVVEGTINATGPTQIKLSRTVPLNEEQKLVPELNAKIWIESDAAATKIAVNATGAGLYTSNVFPLNTARNYRLRINTADGKEYLSKLLPVKSTPEIDSINWTEEKGKVQFYVNTQDPQNSTRYYKWDFDETWEIHSAYNARYMFDNGQIREIRSTDPQIYFCWVNGFSKSIIIGSTAKLQSDRIHLQPLNVIERGDERLGVRYSVLVRQYGLDKDGYSFLEQMKKNTESLGTIFDPQPSALRGNIECISHPKELVIGYISVSAVREKRIFINSSQLTGRGFSLSSSPGCAPIKVKNDPDSIKLVIPPAWPYDAEQMGPSITSYFAALPQCVDCRLRGTNIKPSFW